MSYGLLKNITFTGPTAARTFTLPDADATLMTTAGSGTAITFPGLLSIASGKTLTASNTLTLAGTDASSVAFGAGGTVAYVGVANTWADGVKQTFNPDATNAGVNVGSVAGDPSTPANGDLWYDSTANELTARINGANVSLGAGGLTVGTTTITSGTTTRILYDNAGVLGEYTLTGTGIVVAMQTSPSLITPALGVATATSLNGLTITTSTGTLTVPNGVTLTGPAVSGTAATLDNAETFTANKIFTTTVTTGTGATAGMQVTADSLTTGNGLEVSSSSVTAGNIVRIISTSTAAASNTLTGLSIGISGANGTAAQTVTGATISVTNTNGTSGTNIALSLAASAATTANKALVCAAGIAQFDQAIICTPVVLTDAATIATDAKLGRNFRVTLGGNRTLGAPTNPTDGQICQWEVIQDGTGSRTLALATGAGGFAFGAEITAVTISSGADTHSLITAYYNLTNNRWFVTGALTNYNT